MVIKDGMFTAEPTFERKDPNNPNSMELKPSNLNQTEREAASFLCKPEGVPTPSFHWLIDGVKINSEHAYLKSIFSFLKNMFLILYKNHIFIQKSCIYIYIYIYIYN